MKSSRNFTVSRYSSHVLHLEKEEVKRLFNDGYFVILGKVIESPLITKDEAIELLFSQSNLTIGFSCSEDAFTIKKLGENKLLAKELKPMIHLKKFSFGVSSLGDIIEDYQKKEKKDFGIKFSYPLLFASDDGEGKTRDLFEEAKVFKQLEKYKRKHTKPVKIFYEGKEIQTPFRISEKAKPLAQKQGVNVL